MTDQSASSIPEKHRSANARARDQPSLVVEFDSREPSSVSVSVKRLAPDLIALLGNYAQSGGPLTFVLRVTVLQPEAPVDGSLPDIFGRHFVLEDSLRFVPHFPFERGLSYQASFDPRRLDHPDFSKSLRLEFTVPSDLSAPLPEVKHIFPSSDEMPENLLRFYVRFSNSMQRGRVGAEISLLDSDGEPVHDALYRAPVELWDRSMRCLTILLDPGRLKRGVGPNRELGPPLKVGQEYTLAVGSGLFDLSGNRLRETFHKRFRVTGAVRRPIAVEHWKIVLPAANSRQPLSVMFPNPLDWALLSQAITIVSKAEQAIPGRSLIDQCESRWNFTPTSPWAAGNYHLRVALSLEDVCGNSVIAAFDRPLRSGSDLTSEIDDHSISFQLGNLKESIESQ